MTGNPNDLEHPNDLDTIDGFSPADAPTARAHQERPVAPPSRAVARARRREREAHEAGDEPLEPWNSDAGGTPVPGVDGPDDRAGIGRYPAAEPSAHGVRSRSEPVLLEPEGKINLDGNLNLLLAQGYRVAFRLTGDARLAGQIAVDATRTAATAGNSASYCRIVVANATRMSISNPTPTSSGAEVSHAQHRARLRRDLARLDEAARCITALRHLVGMSPGLVAATVGATEDAVRSTTARWTPEDANSGADALLRGIDNWIGTGATEHSADAGVAPGSELGHLDDPRPPGFVLGSIGELDTGAPATEGTTDPSGTRADAP